MQTSSHMWLEARRRPKNGRLDFLCGVGNCPGFLAQLGKAGDYPSRINRDRFADQVVAWLPEGFDILGTWKEENVFKDRSTRLAGHDVRTQEYKTSFTDVYVCEDDFHEVLIYGKRRNQRHARRQQSSRNAIAMHEIGIQNIEIERRAFLAKADPDNKWTPVFQREHFDRYIESRQREIQEIKSHADYRERIYIDIPDEEHLINYPRQLDGSRLPFAIIVCPFPNCGRHCKLSCIEGETL